ncbi:MAG TPA: hypothetical protein PKL49_04915 [Steroidobacteraceae bacterium]|jgi:hypothetical protein|nr:hypothetical protein [Steroidobacteraceae bacterium]HNS27135.1 hypothetical protein [Steroidobacteraceae bacterium]
MAHVELPRALEHYFAHAETAPTRSGRRFSITMPYLDGERLDRLQWWWQLPATQEKLGGEDIVAKLRAEAVERFSRHIERWLANTGQRFHGSGPIPCIGRAENAPAAEKQAPAEALPAMDSVVNG